MEEVGVATYFVGVIGLCVCGGLVGEGGDEWIERANRMRWLFKVGNWIGGLYFTGEGS